MSIAQMLLGAAGRGLTTYGGAKMQEQEEQRRFAQRDAELKQQEQARINQDRERRALEQQDRIAADKETTDALRTMGIIQPDQTATARTAPFFQSHMANKRAELGINASEQRLQAQIDAMKEVRGAQANNLNASAGTNTARAELLTRTDPNIRAGRGGGRDVDPDADFNKRVMDRAEVLMRGVGQYQRGALPAAQAREQALRDVSALMGRNAAPAAAPGTNLFQGINGGGMSRGGGLESEFPGKSAQIQAAKAQGYSDDEIRAYLRGGR